MLCVVDTLFGDFMGGGSWHQVHPLARTAVPPYTYSIPFRSEAGSDNHPLVIHPMGRRLDSRHGGAYQEQPRCPTLVCQTALGSV